MGGLSATLCAVFAGLNCRGAMPDAAPADDDPDAWRPSAAALQVQDAVIATLLRVRAYAVALCSGV